MAFTAGADFFLILHNDHAPGIAVFCLTHVCYALRAIPEHRKPNGRAVLFAFTCVAVIAAVLLTLDNAIALAGVYASLFAVNLGLNFKFRRVNHNAWLIIAGLILFALCDITVALYNIPNYLGVLLWLRRVYPAIWLFYLPAQTLLALSAITYHKRRNRHEPQ